ncbi:hypothetical protein [Pseudomonas sp.]|uniref:hypothetical protein n=1 Tax=Pseudomonas sp. TaxID=306 RepID=UPI00398263F9
MNIPENGRQQYIEAYSHSDLAKAWSVSLLDLDNYAQENSWSTEHKLYWQDRAIEVLKKGAEEHNYSAVKELLKAVGIARPVGRPSKLSIERQIATEAVAAANWKHDIDRMESIRPLSSVK